MFNRRSALQNRMVLVNLMSGNALEGVCVHEGRDVLTMRGVTVHSSDAEPAQADGEVLVDRINVDFIQVL